MVDDIFFKGLKVGIKKGEPNYVPPSKPLSTKICSNCGGVMELRPLDCYWIKGDEGYYLVGRNDKNKLFLKSEMVNKLLYGCKKCTFAETVNIKPMEEEIVVV